MLTLQCKTCGMAEEEVRDAHTHASCILEGNVGRELVM